MPAQLPDSNERAQRGASQTDAEQERLNKAKDEFRNAMKWLIAAFAAVGALLFAGLSLSSIGGLEEANFAWALAGVILGFGGVSLTLVSAVTVLTAGAVVLEEVQSARRQILGWMFGNTNRALARAINKSPSLMGDYEDLDELFSDIREPARLRDGAREELGADPKPDSKRHNQLVKLIDQQNERARRATFATNRLMPNLNYLAVRHRFRIALLWAVLGIVAASAGLIIFARATNQSEDAQINDARAVPVTVSLTDKGSQLLDDVLGEGCGLSPIPALATDSGGSDTASEADLEVITMPRGPCSAFAFRVADDLGEPSRLCPVSIVVAAEQDKTSDESRNPIPPRERDVSAPITLCPP